MSKDEESAHRNFQIKNKSDQKFDAYINFLPLKAFSFSIKQCAKQDEDPYIVRVCEDFLDVDRVAKMKVAFNKKTGFNSGQYFPLYEYIEIGNTGYMVNNRGGLGDVGYFREYYQFIDDVLVSTSVYIETLDEVARADDFIKNSSMKNLPSN